jgi:hypothetical protein
MAQNKKTQKTIVVNGRRVPVLDEYKGRNGSTITTIPIGSTVAEVASDLALADRTYKEFKGRRKSTR